MQELRLQLAQTRADLRSAKDHYEEVRAFAEEIEIGHGNITGKNKEDRERQMIMRLVENETYIAARDALRKAEAEVDRQEALLEGARDARRYDEWTTRARLIDALIGAGVQSDSNDPAGDAAFDDAMLWRIDHMATTATNGR